ncbi:hypothetical protein V6N13_017252 [Hibiscus sabdariffa]|uniref:Bet v I/Major latex protein domain-containing protein n=1 Tax=Hibiscus sabdariffa TaxID=183260 RepID=A0ABR2CYT0_9ROSI
MASLARTGKPEVDVAKKLQHVHHTITSTKSSALTGKLEADVEIKASPEQFHDMFANKPHHVHRACSDKVQGCDLQEGEWGKVGTIIIWSFVHDGKSKKAKEVIEAVDPGKKLITFREINGDLLKEYKSFVMTIQASPKIEGSGSVVRWTMEYEKLHQGIDHPKTLLQLAVDISKDIDAYLAKPN